ncbi:oligosaccharide flippase family protein [Chryseobacterium taklimakanense]|nr:oligosaccharide flippase family protein [Chryseobacterium taklimakanense]
MVVIGTSPVLSRLFSTESFGLLSIFTSITMFFAVVSTGRYELALGLPENDNKATGIFRLITIISSVVSLFYLFLIVIFKNFMPIPDKTGFLQSWTAYLAPLYIFFIAIYSGLGYWLQRKKFYKRITLANALQVISASVASILFGLFGVKEGLVLSLLIGVLTSIIFIFSKEQYLIPNFSKVRNVSAIAKEYKSFPRYMIFSDLSLTASQQFIPIIFSSLFGVAIVGLYSMANRMIRLPNIVITSAIGNVFRNDAIEELRINGNCRTLYIVTMKKLILMSIPIYSLVFLLSPLLFSFFLGKQWTEAGQYARILSVMLMFEFVAVPLSTIFYIREKQKVYARLQFANAFLGALAIFAGYKIIGTVTGSLYFFVASSVLLNCFFIYFSYKLATYD